MREAVIAAAIAAVILVLASPDAPAADIAATQRYDRTMILTDTPCRNNGGLAAVGLDKRTGQYLSGCWITDGSNVSVIWERQDGAVSRDNVPTLEFQRTPNFTGWPVQFGPGTRQRY